jgi:hypothetical protein
MAQTPSTADPQAGTAQTAEDSEAGSQTAEPKAN